MVEVTDRVKLAQAVCQAVLDSEDFPEGADATIAAPNGVINYLDQGETDFTKVVDAIAPLFRTEATAALEERVKLLEAELRQMLEHYLGIANSGDAGFWDPESEPEVISARAALNDPR